MADEELLKFEITEEDLDSEFSQHKYRRLTKNQQIYGIWADDDDDSEEENHSRKYSKKVKKNYTAPVNFVSGGIHQPGKKQEDDEDDQKVVDENAPVISDSSDEEFAQRPSFSMGKNQAQTSNDSDESRFRPRTFKAANPVFSEQKIGQWEKYTKGIGSKILFGMGFQPGKGLGKKLQGIDAPIEAHLRKGRGAIGAYGPEKKQQKMKTKENSVVTDEEPSKLKKSNLSSQWRKEKSDSQKKIRYVYKTVDEVLEESKKPGKKKVELSALSKVKVIDMTGPEQRVLSGYHAISGVQKPADEWEMKRDRRLTNFDMPELMHNLNLLVDTAEEALIENAQKIEHAENRLKVLEEQAKNLDRASNQETLILKNMKKIIDILETVVPSPEKKEITLKEAEEVFSSLKDNYCKEFFYFQIPVLAVNVVKPLFSKFLQGWRPLEDPDKPISVFLKWRNILIIDNKNEKTAESNQLHLFYKLLWDTWIPCIRNAVNSWESRDCSPMATLIMKWNPYIPKWIFDNILEDMVLRRIQYHVEEWNPLIDPVPIHSWILPWCPFLDKQFKTCIYPLIRQKLSKALTKWHPSDSSARLMLQPWCSVFDPGEMQTFIINNIVPKLQITLQDMIINPNQQCLDNWNWTMEWAEMIPPHAMATLLDRCFFPKWIQTLGVWLNMDPDFEQISKWYSGWKTIIPENVRNQPIVADHLRAALQMMSRAVGGASVPEPQKRETRNLKTPAVEISFSTEGIPTSMKALVQNYCHDAGIIFMPIHNKFFEAKQVYKCGKLNLYFDKNVLFCSQGGGTFTPMSWEEVLRCAQ